MCNNGCLWHVLAAPHRLASLRWRTRRRPSCGEPLHGRRRWNFSRRLCCSIWIGEHGIEDEKRLRMGLSHGDTGMECGCTGVEWMKCIMFEIEIKPTFARVSAISWGEAAGSCQRGYNALTELSYCFDLEVLKKNRLYIEHIVQKNGRLYCAEKWLANSTAYSLLLTEWISIFCWTHSIFSLFLRIIRCK